jgi:hypothetical protein
VTGVVHDDEHSTHAFLVDEGIMTSMARMRFPTAGAEIRSEPPARPRRRPRRCGGGRVGHPAGRAFGGSSFAQRGSILRIVRYYQHPPELRSQIDIRLAGIRRRPRWLCRQVYRLRTRRHFELAVCCHDIPSAGSNSGTTNGHHVPQYAHSYLRRRSDSGFSIKSRARTSRTLLEMLRCWCSGASGSPRTARTWPNSPPRRCCAGWSRPFNDTAFAN